MTDAMPIDLSPADAALAAIALLAALDKYAAARLEAYLPTCPQINAGRADFIAPLIADMAGAADGVEAVLELLAANLPPQNADTAYMLCADYIASHGTSSPEQLRLLARLGETLQLDRLTRAALDRAALVRSRRFEA